MCTKISVNSKFIFANLQKKRNSRHNALCIFISICTWFNMDANASWKIINSGLIVLLNSFIWKVSFPGCEPQTHIHVLVHKYTSWVRCIDTLKHLAHKCRENHCWACLLAMGFLRTRITESPRRNIFEMKRSLFTGFAFFFPKVRKSVDLASVVLIRTLPNIPLPVLGSSVHISFTFSRTILQWRSKAFTLPRSFLLLRQLMSTWVLLRTDSVRTERGPVLNSSSSRFSSS